MKIRVISNIGPREVTLTQNDPTIEDVMSSSELADFQVILPVCKDRQLTKALSETDSLSSQGLNDNSTIYCKFKLKEDETSKPSACSVNKPSGTKTNKKTFSKIGNRKPKSVEALSPMHIKRTVLTRTRPKVSSVDKLLFSPPPPDKKSQVAVASIPKLSMRQCNIASLDDGFMNDDNDNQGQDDKDSWWCLIYIFL